MIVGRDWGFFEQQARKPFVGPAGSLLNRGLKAALIDRAECVVTNVVNKKPPHDEWTAHSVADVRDGVRALHALARREEPALIVAFGEHALHALIAGDPDAAQYRVTESRGYVFPSPFGPVLSCVHPAFVLRAWHPWWALLCLDLQKARRVYSEAIHGGWQDGMSIARRSYHESIILDPAKLPAITEQPTAIDIETTEELDIACIGWSDSVDTGYCAPFREDFFPFFHALTESSAPKILMNGQFDTTILERHGILVENWTDDVMLQWHSVEPLLAGKVTFGDNGDSGAKRTHKSLLFLASILTDQSYWKDYQFQNEIERYTLCARDCRITLEVWENLNERLRQGMVR